MTKWTIGGVAGLLATVPMTIAMLALHRRLPRKERYPLPPVEITAETARRIGAHSFSHGHKLLGATLATHFSYGAATGVIYSVLAERFQFKGVAPGVVYGIGVWTASYLGWLPAAQILTPATRHPARRNALMIVAHIVWGAALAHFSARLRSR